MLLRQIPVGQLSVNLLDLRLEETLLDSLSARNFRGNKLLRAGFCTYVTAHGGNGIIQALLSDFRKGTGYEATVVNGLIRMQ